VIDGTQDPLRGVTLPAGISVLEGAELQQALGHTLSRCRCASDWPVELNHGVSQQILALRIRGKVPPIELVMVADDSMLVPTRVLLLVEEKSEFDFLQVVSAKGQAAHSHLLEIHLGQESKVNHGLLALGDGREALLANLAVEQETRSHYSLVSVSQGWSFGRLEPRVVQVDGQASASIHGLSVTAADEQFAVHTAMRFEGPEGTLDQVQKTIAADRSHSIFNGAIQVPRPAQRTNASQLSRSLLLSGRARIDAKPELEIVADDVRCTHGATVSQLQEDQLFYLRSRGITHSSAAALLLRGYCKEVLDLLPLDASQRWLGGSLQVGGVNP
jgi:Fe-S cluster assembly protein SufD